MRALFLPFLLLTACGEPAVLRQGPGGGAMERADSLPMPRVVEPTGAGRITLADPSTDDAPALRPADNLAPGRSRPR